MKALAYLAIPIILAGCTTPMEITEPPVRAGVIQGVSIDRIADATQMTVRTFTAPDGQRVEVGGLNCTLRSDELYTTFTTPREVMIPRFVQSSRFENRGRPTPVLIRCEGGDLNGVVSIDAESKPVSTATNAGIAGAILTTVVTAAVASSTPWKFPVASNVTVQ